MVRKSSDNLNLTTLRMERRTFLATALAFGVFRAEAAVTSTTMRISGISYRGPYDGGNTLNVLKGTLYFRLNSDRSDRSLNTYGNGTAATNPLRQCPELIKRYAAALGFTNYAGRVGQGDNGNGLPSLGANAWEVAAQFATKSNGGFVFVANGASSLPKPGAVISFAGWATLTPGHVGIILDYSAPNSQATTVTLRLFDQNMPVNTWKEVRFQKRQNRWYGELLNNSVYRPASGWANPAG